MFANSKKQTLAMHSLGVANVALKLFLKLSFQPSNVLKKTFENVENLKQSIFFAGLFHDLGKIDINFQDFLSKKNVTDVNEFAIDGVHFLEKKENNKFSFLNYPRHNEISWALATYLLPNDKLAQYAIYYHHAKVIRGNKGKCFDWGKSEILNLAFNDNEENLKSSCRSFFDQLKLLSKNFNEMENKFKSIFPLIDQINLDCSNIKTPSFLFDSITNKNYEKSNRAEKELNEIKHLLVRSLVVSADRIVSSLTVDELTKCIENNEWSYVCDLSQNINENILSNSIENMLDNFAHSNQNHPQNRTRDKEQSEIAHKLSQKKEVATLFGPAGCGKTKIFLEWYHNKIALPNNAGNDKLFIIAPRKMICSALFNELRKDYIPSAKIELLTGDDKLYWNGETVDVIDGEKKLDADITITTIDQLISVMLSHKKIDVLLEFLNSYVIFDEFHEFFNISGIVILFKLFIRLKNMLDDSKTLLVSATPNYFFLESILGLNISKTVEYIDTFNKEKYQFSFSKYHISSEDKSQLEKSILFEKQEPGTIVIFNTAKASQQSTIAVRDEDSINFHSKFTSEDRKEIYDEIVKNWKSIHPASSKVLRAGPIVQASLNISTMNLITQVCSAESWCQRVGRANRFASNTSMARVVTVLNNKTLSGETTNNSELKFLDKIAAKEQTLAWINYFNKTNFHNEENELSCELTLSEIYKQYKDFHSLSETKEAYENDFEKIIKDSLEVFENNDFTPIEFWKPLKKSRKGKLSSKSIRGKSVYVLPVCYDISQKSIGDWLYIPSDDLEPKKLLTISEQELNGKEALINNQISVLRSLKINGFTDATYESCKKYNSMNSFKIKLEAKNSTSPLLLSYTKDIPDYQIKNEQGLFYVTKGKIKIGLYTLST